MPLPFLSDVYHYGYDAAPHLREITQYLPYLGAIGLIRWYASGAKNGNERVFHGKVIIMTVRLLGIG